METPKNIEITIVVENGMIQDVIANDPTIIVNVIDMDCCDCEQYDNFKALLSDMENDINTWKL